MEDNRLDTLEDSVARVLYEWEKVNPYIKESVKKDWRPFTEEISKLQKMWLTRNCKHSH